MLNTLEFKPDGAAQEYARYGAAVSPLLDRYSAKVCLYAEAATCLTGNGDPDMLALVEPPGPAALYEMFFSGVYQAIHHHRGAGLEGQILYAIA